MKAGRLAALKKKWQNWADALGFPVEKVKILRRKFQEHKYNSDGRGIKFEFTFEGWVRFWKDSGKLHLRGAKKGKYVMARKGDTGPYSPDNVEIILYEDNLSDQIENINRSDQYRSKMSVIMKTTLQNRKNANR